MLAQVSGYFILAAFYLVFLASFAANKKTKRIGGAVYMFIGGFFLLSQLIVYLIIHTGSRMDLTLGITFMVMGIIMYALGKRK